MSETETTAPEGAQAPVQGARPADTPAPALATNGQEEGAREPATPPAEPVVTLPDDGSVACRWCGIAVAPGPDGKHPHPVEAVEGMHQPGQVPVAARQGLMPMPSGPRYRVTRCEQCARRLHEARQIVAASSGWRRRWGTEPAAIDAAESVLAALDHLGRPRTEAHDADAARPLASLVYPGQALRFLARLVPLREPGVPGRGCSSSPWSHLRLAATDPTPAVRDAYAALLRHRLAAAVPDSITRAPVPAPQQFAEHPEVRPDAWGRPHPYETPTWHTPILGGCLMCGVSRATPPDRVPGHALGTEDKRMAATWTPMSTGQQRPHPTGFLCPACAAAVRDTDGTVGPDARDLALSRYYDETGTGQPLQPDEMFNDRQVPTWVTLVNRARDRAARGLPPSVAPRPSGEPWHHLKVYWAAQAAARKRTRQRAEREAHARQQAAYQARRAARFRR